MIEARELSKRFGGVVALDSVSFELPEGSHTALVGPNGAGKSTLLAVLSTLVAPSSGQASIDGLDVAAAPAELRRCIGVMTHLPMVYEELSSRENLLFFARLYGVPELESRVEELLRAVGLWVRRDEPVEVLSRGYHQRLALARTLLHRPRVLLLDEPETGLDEEGLALLDEQLLRAPGVTVLAATHRHDRVDAWADRVLALERGRLVEDAAAAPALRAVR
jgi:ABC-type multidrug transport system ATPase subunit